MKESNVPWRCEEDYLIDEFGQTALFYKSGARRTKQGKSDDK